MPVRHVTSNQIAVTSAARVIIASAGPHHVYCYVQKHTAVSSACWIGGADVNTTRGFVLTTTQSHRPFGFSLWPGESMYAATNIVASQGGVTIDLLTVHASTKA